MGVVQNIRTYCLQEGADLTQSAFNKASEIINEDYAYFQSEKWYRLQTKKYFDPDKFIFLYHDYKQTQEKLIELWKIVNTKRAWNSGQQYSEDKIMSQRWKFAIRRGVPIIYFKSMIQTIFNKRISPTNLQQSYQELHVELESSPRFQKSKQIRLVNSPFLNTAGQEALKRINILLSNHYGKLRYNPYLSELIAIMLVFLQQEKVYLIISFMIETSCNATQAREQSLHWYFTLTEQQLEKFSAQFYTVIKKISPTISVINKHLNQEGINKIQVFKQIISNFFYGYLPFPVIIRIFMIYLNEGVKVFYRFYYAILKFIGPAIRDVTNTNSILRLIKTKLLNQLTNEKQIKKFFRLAFDLRVGKIESLQKIQISSRKQLYQTISYYLPTIQGQSQILSFEDLQTIWEYLPKKLKHYDLRKVFPNPTKANINLKSMKETIEEENFVLILIETLNNHVFGVFLFEKLKHPEEKQPFNKNKSMISNSVEDDEGKLDRKKQKQYSIFNYTGSSQNFVFSLYPEKNQYSSTGQNLFYCLMNENGFAIGGPANKPAIQLDEELLSGLSFCSPTYHNAPLHHGPPGLFRINKIQCFFIQ